MAITFLTDIYNNKGEEFIKKLLSLQVTISEKMSGADFSFEKVKGNVQFYKRNSNEVIGKIDRLLMELYESPIKYIESIDIEKIPEKMRFGFEYFHSAKPNLIKYDNTPKNGLILTYIRNQETGDFEKEKLVLDKYAKEFDVTPPPILFQGKLDNEQQIKLLEYLKKSPKEIKDEYKTKSFTAYLISLVNPKLSKTILNDNIDKMIEGIIFRFENKKDKIYAKIIDPIFNEISSKNKIQSKNDLLPIIFMNMIEFSETIKSEWKSYSFKKVDFEERYIELICYMFNKFITKYKKQYDGVNLRIPNFLNVKEFELNTFLIPNKKTIELVTTNQTFADLFKIYVALFRRKKKKLADFIGTDSVKFQNQLVDNIVDKCKEGNEGSLPTFTQFLSIYEDTQVTDELFESVIPDDIEVINEDKHLKIMNFWQSAFDHKKELKEAVKGKNINIMVGKFQPFNIQHLNTLTEEFETTKLKTIIIQVNNNNDERRPFNEEVSKQMFAQIMDLNTKLIENIIIINKSSLKDILESVSKKYKINTITCNDSYQKFFDKQLKYNLFEDNLDSNIEFKGFKKNANKESYTTKIKEALRDNNLLEFKKLTPNSIHNMFDVFKENLK